MKSRCSPGDLVILIRDQLLSTHSHPSSFGTMTGSRLVFLSAGSQLICISPGVLLHPGTGVLYDLPDFVPSGVRLVKSPLTK